MIVSVLDCEYCHKPTNVSGTHPACVNKFHERENAGDCVVCGEVLDDRDHEWGKNCHSRCEGSDDYQGY